MNKQLWAGLAVGVMMFGMAGVASATTWNAFDDFSKTSNPNGSWTYGEGVTGTTFMPLLTQYDPTAQQWWSSQGWYSSGLPLVAISNNNPIAPGFPNNLLLVHPAGNSAHSDVIVQWTAPITAVYDIDWTFARENNGYSGGVNALIFNNSDKVYESHLGPNQLTTSSQSLSLLAGDVLSFGINDAGWGNGDTSGFNAVITTPTPTPEPATMLLMGTGLAGLIGARRKKKQ